MRDASNASAVVDARQPCADALGYLRPTGGPACPRRARPLVLVAGEGNTGTSTIAWALAQFGLVTAHWRDVLCPETMAGDECAKRKRRWERARHAMETARPAHYWKLDFCELLAPFDAVSDVPIPQLFPFIFARQPHSRVVLTVRTAEVWAMRRTRFTRNIADFSDAAPGGWASWESIRAATRFSNTTKSGAKVQNMREFMQTVGRRATSWAYFAQTALVACAVPPEQLMVVDFFRARPLTPAAHRELWERLGALLRMPPPPTARARAFRGPPVWCLTREKGAGHKDPRCADFWGAPHLPS